MAAAAFAIPIVPGKEEMDRDAFEEMKGSRLEEYEEARRRPTTRWVLAALAELPAA